MGSVDEVDVDVVEVSPEREREEGDACGARDGDGELAASQSRTELLRDFRVNLATSPGVESDSGSVDSNEERARSAGDGSHVPEVVPGDGVCNHDDLESAADSNEHDGDAAHHASGFCPGFRVDNDERAGCVGPRVCRICFEGEDESNEELDSNLCACTGSMACLHKSCLKKWLAESMTLTCEVCKQPFSLSDSETTELCALFSQRQDEMHRSVFAVEMQPDNNELALNHIQNPFLRSCLQRTWRNRGALNSGIIVLIGSSILVMMSLVVYHFLSPIQEEVIAGPLPPGQNFREPMNCSIEAEGSISSAVGWLCGVPSSSIYKGSCSGASIRENQPCGVWNHFTLLQSDLPGCFFGHGSICYVALQPLEESGGVCQNGTCIPLDPGADLDSDVMDMARGLLTQGRCVPCV